MSSFDYIEINEVRNGLKDKFTYFSVADTESKIQDAFAKGVKFKDTVLKIVHQDYHNHLAGRVCTWYFFTCPDCKARCRKVYSTQNNKVACRKCSNIKTVQKPFTSIDKVLRIQEHLTELFGRDLTANRRRHLIKHITSNYNGLNDKYKMVYNTIAFKELQKWCLDGTQDSSRSPEYREALDDVIKILRDLRKVLVFSGLSLSKNKNLKI